MPNNDQGIQANQTVLQCKGKCQLPRLVDMITHDDLTKLLNRKAILTSLRIEIKRACRHQYPLSLMMIDLDHFKKVNDTFGHLTGDMVLKKSAEKMKQSLRLEDFVGRLGGDEFLAILPHTDLGGAMMVANRLVLEFEDDPVTHGKSSIKQTISIGVAAHITGDTAETLLDQVDRALYRAKGEGRNQIAAIK